jgi:hypothetical protein
VRYARPIIEPRAEHAAWYDSIYRDVYRRLYADLRKASHRLAAMNRAGS